MSKIKLLRKIKDCPGKHQAWFETNLGFNVRKPFLNMPEEKIIAKGEFSDKWEKEKEVSLYVKKGNKPITQRQFFYSKYWEFIEKFVLPKFHNVKNMEVLDVGCGRGTISEYLQNRAGVENIYLLDNEEKAIKLAKNNFGNTATYILADATDMPIKSESIDLAVSIGVLEHIDDYTAFFEEQYRVLKQGGIMLCLVLPEKKSIQRFNIFGTNKKYSRKTKEMFEYKLIALKSGFKFFVHEWTAPYPIFTPIPMWIDKIITKVYLGLDWLKRKRRYSFSASDKWGQGYFLISQKI